MYNFVLTVSIDIKYRGIPKWSTSISQGPTQIPSIIRHMPPFPRIFSLRAHAMPSCTQLGLDHDHDNTHRIRSTSTRSGRYESYGTRGREQTDRASGLLNQKTHLVDMSCRVFRSLGGRRAGKCTSVLTGLRFQAGGNDHFLNYSVRVSVNIRVGGASLTHVELKSRDSWNFERLAYFLPLDNGQWLGLVSTSFSFSFSVNVSVCIRVGGASPCTFN